MSFTSLSWASRENLDIVKVLKGFDSTGFLICIPMLEEWKCGEEIDVIDGWTFQASSYLV